MTNPIVKTIEVNGSPARAFARFTEGMASWWPGRQHSVSGMKGTEPKEIVFEAKPGGAVYEITPEGERCDWGRVTEWEPGERFAMTWHPGNSPELATKLELAFSDAPGGRCRVTLIHSGWEVLGDLAEDRRASYDGGWAYVFGECFAGAPVG